MAKVLGRGEGAAHDVARGSVMLFKRSRRRTTATSH